MCRTRGMPQQPWVAQEGMPQQQRRRACHSSHGSLKRACRSSSAGGHATAAMCRTWGHAAAAAQEAAQQTSLRCAALLLVLLAAPSSPAVHLRPQQCLRRCCDGSCHTSRASHATLCGVSRLRFHPELYIIRSFGPSQRPQFSVRACGRLHRADPHHTPISPASACAAGHGRPFIVGSCHSGMGRVYSSAECALSQRRCVRKRAAEWQRRAAAATAFECHA